MLEYKTSDLLGCSDCLPKDKKTMQPNNNLVFHLAGDENEIGAAPHNKPSAAGFEKSNNLVPEASSHHDVAVLDGGAGCARASPGKGVQR